MIPYIGAFWDGFRFEKGPVTRSVAINFIGTDEVTVLKAFLKNGATVIKGFLTIIVPE